MDERGYITLVTSVAVAIAGLIGGLLATVLSFTSDAGNGAGLLALGSTFAGAATFGLVMVWRILSKQIDRQALEITEVRAAQHACEVERAGDRERHEAERLAAEWRIAILIRTMQELGATVPDVVFQHDPTRRTTKENPR